MNSFIQALHTTQALDFFSFCLHSKAFIYYLFTKTDGFGLSTILVYTRWIINGRKCPAGHDNDLHLFIFLHKVPSIIKSLCYMALVRTPISTFCVVAVSLTKKDMTLVTLNVFELAKCFGVCDPSLKVLAFFLDFFFFTLLLDWLFNK